MEIGVGPETWAFDDVQEFLVELAKPHDAATLAVNISPEGPGQKVLASMRVTHHPAGFSDVRIYNASRGTVAAVSLVFDQAAARMPHASQPKPTIFIGHGGASQQWRLLKDHLHEQQGYEVVAYETGARSGLWIGQILEELLRQSTFALLVMTAEDEQADGTRRARENVVNEAGLFQGRLGFPRAIVLLEEGVQPFSNLAGLQYIPFKRDNIRESFGDVLATIRREFPTVS